MANSRCFTNAVFYCILFDGPLSLLLECFLVDDLFCSGISTSVCHSLLCIPIILLFGLTKIFVCTLIVEEVAKPGGAQDTDKAGGQDANKNEGENLEDKKEAASST